jgi:hypothetical protein
MELGRNVANQTGVKGKEKQAVGEIYDLFDSVSD